MKRNIGMLALIMAFWFTISFITNILGPLIPDIIHNFNLSDLAMAGFIPTSFFLAYAIMSIPAGLLIDRFGEKPVLFGGFLMPFIGTILFACMHTYPMLLASSFIIGLGTAAVRGEAALRVIGHAGVERAVTAAQDVDPPPAHSGISMLTRSVRMDLHRAETFLWRGSSR